MLLKIGFLTDLLLIFLYWIFWKRNKHGGIWAIMLSAVLSIFTDYMYNFARHSINTLYFYGAFTIIEYTLFAIFLYLSFRSRFFKIILLIFSGIFYLIAISNFFIKNNLAFDSLSASVEAILIIIYSIFYLYQQVNDPSIFLIYNTKKFWIILAFLIYFSSTLFLFIYATTMTHQEHKNYWNINNFFDVLKNVLFSVGFIMKNDKKNQYTGESQYPDPR